MVCVARLAVSEPNALPEVGIANGELRFTRRGSGARAEEARATSLEHDVTNLPVMARKTA